MDHGLLGFGVVAGDQHIALHFVFERLELAGAEVMECADHAGVGQQGLGLLGGAALLDGRDAGLTVDELQRHCGIDHDLRADVVAQVVERRLVAVERHDDHHNFRLAHDIAVDSAVGVGLASDGGEGVADLLCGVGGALGAARADQDTVVGEGEAHRQAEAFGAGPADKPDRGHSRSHQGRGVSCP